MKASEFMYAAERVRISLFRRNWYSLLHIHHILCLLSSVNGRLGFQAWPALGKAVITIVVLRPLSVPDLTTSEDMSEIEIAESCSKFVCERNL